MKKETNEEQLQRIDTLRATLEEKIKTNSYGLVKINNVVCNRTDLDNLYFITGLLKSGYSAETFSEDFLTDAVKKVLSKTKIDLSLGDDYIEKKLKDKEEHIKERVYCRTKITKEVDDYIEQNTFNEAIDYLGKYKAQKEIKDLLNKDDALEEIKEAFIELFTKNKDFNLDKRKEIIKEFFSYARDFISSKVKLAELNELEEEIKETYITNYSDAEEKKGS